MVGRREREGDMKGAEEKAGEYMKNVKTVG